MLLGSANFGATLAKEGLIDTYQVIINPVLLGAGVPLFQGVDSSRGLELTSTRTFANGNLLASYAPRRA